MSNEVYFNKEAKTLVGLANQKPDIAKLAEGMGQSFDYDQLLNLSYEHRVLPLVFYHVGHNENLSQQFPMGTREIGRIVAKAQEYRMDSLLDHAKDVFSALSNAEVRFMIFRGLLLATTVYEQPSWRNVEDIDLLVEEPAEPKIDQVLKDLGYVQGSFDAKTGKIIPFTQEQLDFWSQERQHLGSYLLPTEDPFTAAVKIDVHHRLTNTRDPFAVSGEELLEKSRSVTVLGQSVEAINLNDLLIFLCVHVHSHYRWLYEMSDRNDMHISRFTDILEMVRKYGDQLDWDAVIARTRKFGVEFPVSLGLFWTKELFGEFMPKGVFEQIVPENFDKREREITFRDVTDDDRAIGEWQEKFVERLFNPRRYNRALELTGLTDTTGHTAADLSHYHF